MIRKYQVIWSASHSTVVLYIGIIKVWGFLPKNPTYKSAKYLLCDHIAALVRYNQAQKCLQINSKPLHQVAIKFLKISYSTDFSTD